MNPPRIVARSAAALLLAAVTCTGAMAQESAAASAGRADAEIRALIAQLGSSGCRFQRNGRWHAATDAQAHLQRKYDWARRRGLAGDAGRFIEAAARRSSTSGRAYRVACPGEPERDAGEWFEQRLAALRAD